MTEAIPPAGAHGGDGAAVARSLGIAADEVLDLSASLNPFAPDVVALAAGHTASLAIYPDPTAATLALADAMGIDPDRLLLTNGGAEAIALVAAERGDGLVVAPDFSLYGRHLLTGSDASGGRWRSNPSSPLGSLAAADETAAVWDEAFWPMTVGTWSRGDVTSWRVGSLTKLWACPGLRIGYLIAPDAASRQRVADRQPQWSVNGLALALVPDLLAAQDLPATATSIVEHRRRFAAAVTGLGYAVAAGVAPWLLLDATPGLRDTLAPAGIVVRDCTSFGLPGVHRVALPRPADTDRVLTSLAACTVDRERSP